VKKQVRWVMVAQREEVVVVEGVEVIGEPWLTSQKLKAPRTKLNIGNQYFTQNV
jgi:hypothetical protein